MGLAVVRVSVQHIERRIDAQVMQITENFVKQSENSLEDASQFLLDILKQAADDTGQWHLPLANAEVEKMRQFMKANMDRMDESLLATTYAWMRKASDDKSNEGVIPLLQKVLQLFAADCLSRSLPNPLDAGNAIADTKAEETSSDSAYALLKTLLETDESEWNAQLQSIVSENKCTEDALLVELQKKKELIILAMRGGMYEQRVLVS